MRDRDGFRPSVVSGSCLAAEQLSVEGAATRTRDLFVSIGRQHRLCPSDALVQRR